MSKIRILIAENNRDYVRLMAEFFSKQPDIEIIGVAYDGNQTMALIGQTKPDVLLLDLIMPDMDGLEVLKRINQEGIKLKVHVISAVGSGKLVEMAAAYHVEHYFVKPVNLHNILRIILEDR